MGGSKREVEDILLSELDGGGKGIGVMAVLLIAITLVKSYLEGNRVLRI